MHEELYQEIEELGRGLRGLHVIRINATPQGGGVAEILQRLVPLLRSVGIDAQWRVMPPDEPFFAVSKHLHNLLQGAHGTLTGDEQRIYREHNERTYAAMAYLHPDLWEIHDPQPAAAGAWLNHGVPKVWRCHIDTAAPNPAAAAFLRPYLAPYEAHVYSHASYALPGAPSARAIIIEPAIDPLQLKNRRLAQARTRAILTWLGLDPQRPLVAQVARLDPWKDPCGVIDAFRLARARVPGLQLALLGVM
ncbi:MAG TPA: glycosyl transferase family 1, partial [Vicinamibacteria bacterium]|nr:glycosyl transferase family 1 [Vicinamibacteria bacterium]